MSDERGASSESGAGEAAAPEPQETFRPPRVSRLRVLRNCVLFIFVAGAAGHWIWTLLPGRWSDGPMLQDVSETAASLVWYTSKPVADQRLVIRVGAVERTMPVAHEETRHRVRVSGLQPGTTYAYRILTGERTWMSGEFATNKPRGQAFSFVVFGDSGRATAEQFALAAQMQRLTPDFLLHTGDLVYSAGERADFPERFFQPYRELLARVCFWPSLGNHDVSERTHGGDYLGVFELPENGPAELDVERHYWFDYADARFVIVDSNADASELEQRVAPWLSACFADARDRWRFVVFHHPPYTCGPHGPDERIQRALVPAMEAAGVHMVFSGHDHLYERTAPLRGGQPADDGVVYIVSGAGGARLYEAAPAAERPSYFLAVNDHVHSFSHVAIEGEALTLRQIDVGGQVIDTWSCRRR